MLFDRPRRRSAALRASASIFGLGVALLAWPMNAAAQGTMTWNGGYSNEWTDARNWSVSDLTSALNAVINQDATLVLEAGRSAETIAFDIGAQAGDENTLTINGLLTSSGEVKIAEVDGNESNVVLSGDDADWDIIGSAIRVGHNGKGALRVEDGAELAAGEIAVGQNGGSEGSLIIDDASAESSGNTIVGWIGTGALILRNGATMNSGVAVVGQSSTGLGTATVRGADTTWTISGELNVGRDDGGEGTLNVSEGGVVSADQVNLGRNAGSSGTATVSGNGSRLSGTSAFVIGAKFTSGAEATGVLTLVDGGVAAVGDGDGALTIADAAGATGTLIIGAAEGSAAAAPGRVEAASVEFGDGDGAIIFNHTDQNYTFAPDVTGNGAMSFLAGRTILTGD